MDAKVRAWVILQIVACLPLSADVLFAHLGGIDPVSEGFFPTHSGTSIANDMGFAAWQYSGNGSPSDYHAGALTAQQKLAAFSQGWQVDLRARLPQNGSLLFGDMDFGNIRYDINLLLSPSGNLTAVLNNFGVGGSIAVSSATAPGVYNGAMDVTVDYN